MFNLNILEIGNILEIEIESTQRNRTQHKSHFNILLIRTITII